MNDVSRCWFLFFSLFFAIKKEKKEEKEFQLKKSSREKEAKNQFTKGGLFVCKYERIDEFKLSSFF